MSSIKSPLVALFNFYSCPGRGSAAVVGTSVRVSSGLAWGFSFVVLVFLGFELLLFSVFLVVHLKISFFFVFSGGFTR